MANTEKWMENFAMEFVFFFKNTIPLSFVRIERIYKRVTKKKIMRKVHFHAETTANSGCEWKMCGYREAKEKSNVVKMDSRRNERETNNNNSKKRMTREKNWNRNTQQQLSNHWHVEKGHIIKNIPLRFGNTCLA